MIGVQHVDCGTERTIEAAECVYSVERRSDADCVRECARTGSCVCRAQVSVPVESQEVRNLHAQYELPESKSCRSASCSAVNAFWSVSQLSWCDRLKSASVARTVVESGGGEAACFDMHSIRIEGMKGGTSYGKALTSDETPRTAESVKHSMTTSSQQTSVKRRGCSGSDLRAATSASW